MPWAESERILNVAVQRMYRERAVVVATGRPLSGVFYAPYQASRESAQSYGVDMEVPQPALIVYNADVQDVISGTTLDLRGKRYTVIDTEPESYGQTRLVLAEYF